VFVQRVVAGVSGSGVSVQALRYAADLARCQDAVLVPVLAYAPPGGEFADRRYPCAELRAVWKESAWDRLWRAVEMAIGGPPDGLRFRPEVIRGDPADVLTLLARQPGDVLVIGAGRHGGLRRSLHCRVARYCLGHAACPVIAVPPSELAGAAHGLRGWMDRHRLQPEDAQAPAGA
jgi:nucleotide-binding universal stress UspA family protein